MCQYNEKIQFFTSFLSSDGNVVFKSNTAGETIISYLLKSIDPKKK